MVQEIITYGIVLVAVGLAVLQAVKTLRRITAKVNNNPAGEQKCGGCTAECSLHERSVSKKCAPVGTSKRVVLH